jgi:predicted nucleic acid-binding protein
VKIYLDNCCFNRPFDDQRQTRIRIEAEAKLSIQGAVRGGTLELVWSYMLDFENAENPFEERQAAIDQWRQYAKTDVEQSDNLLEQARALVGAGLDAKDALHVACAIAGGCSHFLTTDDKLLKRAQGVSGITVMDPAAFVREANL